MNLERLATLQKLLEIDPGDVFARYGLGLEWLEAEPARAEESFRQVLDTDPSYVAAYFQLGQLKAAQHDWEAARGWLEKGIEIAEQVGDSHALEEMQDFLDQL